MRGAGAISGGVLSRALRVQSRAAPEGQLPQWVLSRRADSKPSGGRTCCGFHTSAVGVWA